MGWGSWPQERCCFRGGLQLPLGLEGGEPGPRAVVNETVECPGGGSVFLQEVEGGVTVERGGVNCGEGGEEGEVRSLLGEGTQNPCWRGGNARSWGTS